MPEAQSYGRDFMTVVELHRTSVCLPVSMNHSLLLISPVTAVVISVTERENYSSFVFPVYFECIRLIAENTVSRRSILPGR